MYFCYNQANHFIMGLNFRKEMEKQKMRMSILQATKELFLKKGIIATSVRDIAKQMHYTHGTIYLYFKDKDDIFYNIIQNVFKDLEEEIKPLMSISDPLQRLVKMGKVYVNFVRKNPELYNLTFSNEIPPTALVDLYKKDKEFHLSFFMMKETMQECIDLNLVRCVNIENLSILYWGVLHGLVTLESTNHSVIAKVADVKSLTDSSLSVFIELIKS